MSAPELGAGVPPPISETPQIPCDEPRTSQARGRYLLFRWLVSPPLVRLGSWSLGRPLLGFYIGRLAGAGIPPKFKVGTPSGQPRINLDGSMHHYHPFRSSKRLMLRLPLRGWRTAAWHRLVLLGVHRTLGVVFGGCPPLFSVTERITHSGTIWRYPNEADWQTEPLRPWQVFVQAGSFLNLGLYTIVPWLAVHNGQFQAGSGIACFVHLTIDSMSGTRLLKIEQCLDRLLASRLGVRISCCLQCNR